MVVLLLGAGVIGLIVGETIEILVILAVNTFVGFVTELQAARSMATLREMMGTVAEVERDDRRDEIDATGLVPGDIVGIEAGEQMPADLGLIETEDLQIEEPGLTGKSDAITKSTGPVDESAGVGDRTDMVFMGTTVQARRGRGVVVPEGLPAVATLILAVRMRRMVAGNALALEPSRGDVMREPVLDTDYHQPGQRWADGGVAPRSRCCSVP